MERFSIREVIEQAVQTERLGALFYGEMAKKFGEEDEIKKLFENLAAKEVQHERTFAGLTDKVKDEGMEGWEEVSSYLRAIVESAFFLGKGKSLPSMNEIETAYDAVTYALGFEKETLLYYLELKDYVPEKDILEEIINEERTHIRSLNSMRQDILKKAY
jgi:rubrerythrin